MVSTVAWLSQFKPTVFCGPYSGWSNPDNVLWWIIDYSSLTVTVQAYGVLCLIHRLEQLNTVLWWSGVHSSTATNGQQRSVSDIKTVHNSVLCLI